MRIPLKWFLLGSAALAAAIGMGKRYYDHRQWLAAPADAGSRANFDPHEYDRWVTRQKANQEELRAALRGSYFQWNGYELFEITVNPGTDLSRLSMLSEATELEVFISSTRLGDEDLVWAKDHPNLRKLLFPDTIEQGITNRSLPIIGSCGKLEQLSFQACGITDDGLVYLANLDQLTQLDLIDCPVTGRGLASLSALPRLTHLRIFDCPLDDEGLAGIAQLSQLEHCELRGEFSGAGLHHLAALPKLKSLSLYSPVLADISGLAELENVQSLSLSNQTPLRTGMLKHIAGMDSLRSLNLGLDVTDDMLRQLADADQILELSLGRTKITDCGLVHLQNLSGIRTLNLAETQITDAGLVHLEKMTSLHEIYLRQTAVTEAGARPLSSALPRAKISFGVTTIEPRE